MSAKKRSSTWPLMALPFFSSAMHQKMQKMFKQDKGHLRVNFSIDWDEKADREDDCDC